MRTLRAADLATGVFLTALAILALIASMQITGSAGERLHSRTVPVILSWMLLGGGIALTVGGWRYRGEPRRIDWPDSRGKRRILVTMAALIMYLALLEPVGLPLGTLFFVSFLVWYLGRYRFWLAALCGLATALVVLLVFIVFLGLTFPIGPLEYL